MQAVSQIASFDLCIRLVDAHNRQQHDLIDLVLNKRVYLRNGGVDHLEYKPLMFILLESGIIGSDVNADEVSLAGAHSAPIQATPKQIKRPTSLPRQQPLVNKTPEVAL